MDGVNTWDLDLGEVWRWVGDALEDVAKPVLDRRQVDVLCADALDRHAPAVTVEGQGAGIAVDVLVGARLAEAYLDRYGRTPNGRYLVAGLRAVARDLSLAPTGERRRR